MKNEWKPYIVNCNSSSEYDLIDFTDPILHDCGEIIKTFFMRSEAYEEALNLTIKYYTNKLHDAVSKLRPLLDVPLKGGE